MATWPYYLFAVAAGAMLPIQFGINAELARYVDSPARATLVSFAVGTVVLLVAMLVFSRGVPVERARRRRRGGSGSAASLAPSTCSGASSTAPKLGAAALVALILAGQAAASLMVDHFGLVGFEENPITPGRLLGIALVAAGVVLVRVF